MISCIKHIELVVTPLLHRLTIEICQRRKDEARGGLVGLSSKELGGLLFVRLGLVFAFQVPPEVEELADELGPRPP